MTDTTSDINVPNEKSIVKRNLQLGRWLMVGCFILGCIILLTKIG